MGIRIAALVVAGGRGQRAGGDVPKQYADLAGASDTILGRSIDAFLHAALVDDVRVVIHRDDTDQYQNAIGDRLLSAPVHGGATRQQSVRAGLEAYADDPPALILVHDAARPFVSQATIAQVIGALAIDAGAIAAVPVADTLKRADADGHVAATQARAEMWQAQTPQGFRYDAIMDAHRAAAGRDLSDDAAVAEMAGIPIRLVPDRRDNFKITTAEDLIRARAIARIGRGGAIGDVRVGHGFDVHRMMTPAADRPLMLCGVAVAAPFALAGHSDADVGLHALADALYGALADHDIGAHFPPTEPRWRDAPSDQFVRFAAECCRADGLAINHVDVTLICERPRIGPHRAAMRAALSSMLAIPIDRVSVKATTTERLGFTGRGEGIAAMATATLVRDDAA